MVRTSKDGNNFTTIFKYDVALIFTFFHNFDKIIHIKFNLMEKECLNLWT